MSALASSENLPSPSFILRTKDSLKANTVSTLDEKVTTTETGKTSSPCAICVFSGDGNKVAMKETGGTGDVYIVKYKEEGKSTQVRAGGAN
jgi:hypothetical protein